MSEIILVFSFVLSFLLAIYGTPIAKNVAYRYKILDHPDGGLKNQAKPVPYLGGLIIYFAFISPISLMFTFNKELLGILFAGSILLIVGLFDDLRAMTPGIKFVFQIVATYILMKSGIYLDLMFLPAWLNTILSFIWILSMINAFNIIDIMDGLAASSGMIACFTTFLIALLNGNFLISILSISLGAALAGFLKFNWQPATIYLGDSGSMFIGLVIGSIVILLDYSYTNDFAFISGALILTIPAFDMLYVIILRLLKGKSPFFGTPDHFALRLKKKYKLSSAKTVLIIGMIQLLLSGVIIWNFYSIPQVTIITSAIIVLFFITWGFILAKEKME